VLDKQGLVYVLGVEAGPVLRARLITDAPVGRGRATPSGDSTVFLGGLYESV
jgi:hypothetical protein